MAKNIPFEMAYIDTKTEITLLLIHGFPLTSRMWWPQINSLDRVARIIAPDLRGFGLSQMADGKQSIMQYADDCKSLLDRLGVSEPVVVCGLSMGGYIAMEFVRKYPKMVRGLVLTATRAAPDTEGGRAGRDVAIASVEKNGIEAITRGMAAKLLSNYQFNRNDELINTIEDIMADATEAGMIDALLAMRDRRDSRDLLRKITTPTLIVHGEDDKIVPIAEAKLMDEMIMKSHFVGLVQAGHLPNMEQPDLWNDAVEAFLYTLLD